MEFSAQNQIIKLDSFEPALVGPDTDAASQARRFSTLIGRGAPAPFAGTHPQQAHIGVQRVGNAFGEQFALKRLHLANAADSELARKSFAEEYRMMQQVSLLQGFPQLYGFGSIGKDPVIVMEWVDGSTLAQLGKAGAEFSPRAIAKLGCAVLDALFRARQVDESLVHRDLSPANIVLRGIEEGAASSDALEDPDVCLIDLGSAALQTADPSFTMRAGAWRGGTPEYAPPEMLTPDVAMDEGLRRSPAIDTYALCSILYELYAHRTPYSLIARAGESPYLVKTTQAPEPLVARAPEDQPLVSAIMSGIVSRASDRPAQEELRAALEDYLLGKPTTLKPRDSLLTRRKFVAGGILAAGVVAAATILGISRGRASGTRVNAGDYQMAASVYDGDPLYRGREDGSSAWTFFDDAGDAHFRFDGRFACGHMSCGLIAAYDNASGLWGFITPADTSEGYAWAILPAFSQAGDFSNGLCAAKDPAKSLWGYIGTNGAWSIEPRFTQASAFANGMAACADADANPSAAWGAVDKSGSWATQPRFSYLGALSDDGCACAQDADDSWGIVDASGSWTCKPSFALMRDFADGTAPALDGESGLWGFVDAQGTWSIEPKYANALTSVDGACAVQDASSKLWGFIDRDGKAICEPRFCKLGILHDGLSPAQSSPQDDTIVFDDGSTAEDAGLRYGYVDVRGQWHLKRAVNLIDVGI